MHRYQSSTWPRAALCCLPLMAAACTASSAPLNANDPAALDQALAACAPDTSAPAVCGNHVLELGETCDDGNQQSGDGCSQYCLSEAPGNDVFATTHPLHAQLLPTTQNAPNTDTAEHGTFRLQVDPSHISYDDPIVHACVPGSAHLHTFFGNVSTDASTTTGASLLSAPTSTSQGGPLNKTAYWVPTMLRPVYKQDSAGNYVRSSAGKPIPVLDASGKQQLAIVWPASDFKLDKNGVVLRDAAGNPLLNANLGCEFYYKRANIVGDMSPMPQGLRMISGTATSTAPQSKSFIHWSCHETQVIHSESDFSSSIPACTPNPTSGAPDYNVHLSVLFPDCWDGVHLDSADHKSHMSFAVGNYPQPGLSCPASHPVALPRVSFELNYPINRETLGPTGDTSDWFLSSDMYTPSASQPGGMSAHADWFMGWNRQVMTTFVQHCINEGRHCANGDLGNGYRLAAQVPGVGNQPPIPILGFGQMPMGGMGGAGGMSGAAGMSGSAGMSGAAGMSGSAGSTGAAGMPAMEGGGMAGMSGAAGEAPRD